MLDWAQVASSCDQAHVPADPRCSGTIAQLHRGRTGGIHRNPAHELSAASGIRFSFRGTHETLRLPRFTAEKRTLAIFSNMGINMQRASV